MRRREDGCGGWRVVDGDEESGMDEDIWGLVALCIDACQVDMILSVLTFDLRRM